MKIKNLTTKSKILAGVTASFMLFANCGLVFASSSKQALLSKVHADYTPTEVTLTNGNFANPSSGSLPYSPTNWTVLNKSGDITCGIIDLGSTFEDKQIDTYNLNFKPDTTVLNDNQVLMINSSNTNSSCGYKSAAFKLSANSHYVITFKAYTENTTNHSAFGSAILTGDSSAVLANSVLRINTSDKNTSNWKTYSIFVETDQINEKNLNLELWLGEKDGNKSNGAIFFDDVKVMCYDNNTYETIKQGRNTDVSMVVNFNTDYVDNFITNSSFENGLNGWSLIEGSSSTTSNQTIAGVFNVNTGYNSVDTGIELSPTNANIYGNNNALLINNIDKGHVGYRSSYFTVKQNAIYKLSFIAKTSEIDGSALVKLVERNPYTNEYLSDGTTKNPNYYANSSYTAKEFKIDNITTKDYTNAKTNDWKYYSFYIVGSPYLNSELSLEIWLGSVDADASGYAFFDHFTLQQLNSADYNAGNSQGTVANLGSTSTSTNFGNIAFNNVVLTTPNDTAPYTPADWSLVRDNNSSFNGVINTANSGNSNIPAIKPISSTYPNNNVLMIGNTADNNQKYTSNTVSLSADSYVKIEVSVLTYNLNKASAGIRLVSEGNILGEHMNISDSDWTTYTFVVKTGYESKSVNLELSLGETANGTGYAFFDNVVMTSDLTEEDYNAEILNSKKINLASYDFSNVPTQATNGKYLPYDFNATNNSNTNQNYLTTGIIDTAKFGQADGCIDSNYPNPSHPQNTNSHVLMIESSDDTYYSYTTKVASNLSQGNYYKIVVFVKTNGVCQNSQDSKVLLDGSKTKYHPYGASISVNGLDAKFTGIDTNGEWKEYTIFVNCTTSVNVNLQLSLGDANAYTSGAVYYSSATISKIEQNEYSEGVKVLEDEPQDNLMAIGNTDVESSTEDTDNNTGITFDWMLVPAIITALAVLVGVVGTIVRNAKRKSKKKPVILQSYSKQNLKRLNENHKNHLAEIDKQIAKINKEQGTLAIEINNARQNGDSENKIKELQNKYSANNDKIKKLEDQKQLANQEHKTLLRDLKEEKTANDKMKK